MLKILRFHSVVENQSKDQKFGTKDCHPYNAQANQTSNNEISCSTCHTFKIHLLFSTITSPELTVMICGVKLAPTEQATHSPTEDS